MQFIFNTPVETITDDDVIINTVNTRVTDAYIRVK